MAKKSETFVLDGTVEEAPPNATFRVPLENGHLVMAYVNGAMRQHRIRVLPGDRVQVESSLTT